MTGVRETTLSDMTSLTISGAHKNDRHYVSGWARGLTNRKDARKAYQSMLCLRCIYSCSHNSAQQVKVLTTVGCTKGFQRASALGLGWGGVALTVTQHGRKRPKDQEELRMGRRVWRVAGTPPLAQFHLSP